MPDFTYESLTNTGQVRSGMLNAADRADAMRQLLGRGETATSLVEAGGRGSRSGAPAITFRRNTRPSMGRAELGNLIRELATAIEAGLPLMQSLRTVRRQASGKAMPVILDHLIDRVEAGDPIHQAARDYGAPFDDMVVGMLRAADASGEMSSVMHQLADLIDRQVELRREVLGATVYPMIVAVLILASVIILVTFLVPSLIEPLAGSIELPWPTRVLLGLANFFQSFWMATLAAVGVVAIAAKLWLSSPANRELLDNVKLKAPIVGRLMRDVSVARFTRTLGTLTSAGLPILDALRITKHTLGNAALTKAINEVEDQVTAGKPLADPLERSGLFPPLLVQVVSLGERSGRLESMLLHASSAFDRRVNTSIKIFTKTLPPLLLIVMASVGGFVLAAILLPLLNLQSMIQ
ncbi:MAG: type II secretion system F family protein [Planctomycetota bacterium]|jgi:type II secretory pathway component PulF